LAAADPTFLTFDEVSRRFARIEPGGATVELAAAHPGRTFTDLAWCRGRLYAIESVGGGSALVRVDPADGSVGAAVPVAGGHFVKALASDGIQLLVGYGANAGSAAETWAVLDPATGVSTFRATLAYDCDGAGYGGGRYYSADVTSGSLVHGFRGALTPTATWTTFTRTSFGDILDWCYDSGVVYGLSDAPAVHGFYGASGGLCCSLDVLGTSRYQGIELLLGTERTALAQTLDLDFGRVDAGDVSSLATADGSVLRVCKFVVPNSLVPPVRFRVGGTLPDGPLTSLALRCVSRMATAGAFQQTLEMFDFVSGGYDSAGGRTDALGTALSSRELAGTGDLARYVGPNAELAARVSVRRTGPSAVPAWCFEADALYWRVP
jgi:hypothetical protein